MASRVVLVRGACAALVAVSVVLGGCSAGPPTSSPPPGPATAGVDADTAAKVGCGSLLERNFRGVPDAPFTLTDAHVVAASAQAEEYCQVAGRIDPEIDFQVRLPTAGWNGRYLQAGCGGFCGVINIDGCGDMLAKDFVVAAQNMGHTGSPLTDAAWGADPAKRADYGRRSTHVTAVAAKEIVSAFYGTAPAYSYFRGCSTGGREGLSEAQHYPDDFDGIVAGDPAFPGRLGALSNNWDTNHLVRSNGAPMFGAESAQVLHSAVMQACDGLDELRDGIIEDPRTCTFDPRVLQCPPGAGVTSCLTTEQVGAARALYDGPRNSKGVRLSPGTSSPYGSELTWATPELNAGLAVNSLKGLLFAQPRPDYDYRSSDWDALPDLIEPQAALYDPVAPRTRPDLSVFEKAGGKLIAYHGWADPGVPAEGTLDYYATATRDLGGIAAARDWFRVFMVPGMLHCRGGDAPNTFDFMPAIQAWVEHGTPPAAVTATQFNADKTVQRTRPLYPYPEVARYTGTGDVDDAGSWRSETPAGGGTDDAIDWIWAPR